MDSIKRMSVSLNLDSSKFVKNNIKIERISKHEYLFDLITNIYKYEGSSIALDDLRKNYYRLCDDFKDNYLYKAIYKDKECIYTCVYTEELIIDTLKDKFREFLDREVGL